MQYEEKTQEENEGKSETHHPLNRLILERRIQCLIECIEYILEHMCITRSIVGSARFLGYLPEYRFINIGTEFFSLLIIEICPYPVRSDIGENRS